MSLPGQLPKPNVWPTAIALILLGGLYLYGLGDSGLLGPDEPRYAYIGRGMAQSNDWITPRLLGKPWFEKPALLYWLIGAGHAAGLTTERAARVPVASLSLAFLVFYAYAVRRLAGERAGFTAVLMLGLSAGWLSFSQVAATDLPLAATFNAAILAALLYLEEGWRPGPWVAGVCFGLALLAKGLVAAVLVLPLLWFARAKIRGLSIATVVALATAVTWYVPMFVLHGRAFFDEFFLRHHFGRFASDELQHAQPFWFYVPVMVGWVFPWVPFLFVAVLRPSRRWPQENWRQALLAVVALGLLFFSASANKLPGYLAPLLPGLAALIATWLDRMSPRPRLFLWAGFLLFLVPVAARVLPEALMHGITNVHWEGVPYQYFVYSGAAALAGRLLEGRGHRILALTALAAFTGAGALYLKLSAFPVLDKVVSARELSRRVKAQKEPVCVEKLHRSLRYGLDYYLPAPLPSCSDDPRPIEVYQPDRALPNLRRWR